MGLFTLKRKQKIPASAMEVWDFISSPANLSRITPAYMSFNIRTPNLPGKIYAGMRIAYTIKPVLGIKLNWVTEITEVNTGNFFVDEQRTGPYAIWRHRHILEKIDGGVLMTDIVNYQPPFGLIGTIANTLFIEKQLDGIFDFRYKAIEQIFGKFQE